MLLKAAILCSLLCVALGLTDSLFEKFKERHNKNYSKAEEAVRRKVFSKNVKQIVRHNLEAQLGQHNFTLAINEFADLTNDEFRQRLGFVGKKISSSNYTFAASGSNDLPAEVDWRDKNLVTEVKNQGSCGSCWAFAAIASLEGQHAKKSGKLESFSEQELVDCSRAEGNQGCNGGFMDPAFKYLEKSGIESEDSYPYEGRDGNCRFDQSKVVDKVTGYVDVTSGSEQALQEALAKIGPVAVAIDAGSFWFQFYFGGVYSQKGCNTKLEKLNHGVTVVGYGNEKGKDYWLIKNSWGKGWGIQGYFKLARNSNNMCGVATLPSYPLV